MAAEKGRKFLLKISDGVSPVVYKTLGGMRSTAMNMANAPVDITNKDSETWRTLLANAGDKSMELSAAGPFVGSDAEDSAQALFLAGSIFPCQIWFEEGDGFEGDFQITGLDYTGEYNGARMYSIKLSSSGEFSHNEHMV